MEFELNELCWIRLEKGRILAYYAGEISNGHAFVAGVDAEEMCPVPESRIEKIPLARKSAASTLLIQQIEREDMLEEFLFQNAQKHSRALGKCRIPYPSAGHMLLLLTSTWNYCKLWLTNPAKLSPK
jgi:hypothetical protein